MKRTEYVVELKQYNGVGAMGSSWQAVPDGRMTTPGVAENARDQLIDEGFPADHVRVRKITVTEVYEEVDLGPEKVRVIGKDNAPAIRVKTSAGEMTIRNEKDDLVDRVVIDLPGLSSDHTYQLIIDSSSFYFKVDNEISAHRILSRWASS